MPHAPHAPPHLTFEQYLRAEAILRSFNSNILDVRRFLTNYKDEIVYHSMGDLPKIAMSARHGDSVCLLNFDFVYDAKAMEWSPTPESAAVVRRYRSIEELVNTITSAAVENPKKVAGVRADKSEVTVTLGKELFDLLPNATQPHIYARQAKRRIFVLDVEGFRNAVGAVIAARSAYDAEAILSAFGEETNAPQ